MNTLEIKHFPSHRMGSRAGIEHTEAKKKKEWPARDEGDWWAEWVYKNTSRQNAFQKTSPYKCQTIKTSLKMSVGKL